MSICVYIFIYAFIGYLIVAFLYYDLFDLPNNFLRYALVLNLYSNYPLK